jgi:hypothetical protein
MPAGRDTFCTINAMDLSATAILCWRDTVNAGFYPYHQHLGPRGGGGGMDAPSTHPVPRGSERRIAQKDTG